MRPLPATPVFDRSAARELGWSDAALTRAARSGTIVRLRHGLFARPGLGATGLMVPIAAALAVSGSAVSHRSALAMHDLPIVGARPRAPELTVQPSGTGSAHRALLHRATLTADDLVDVAGVATTSVARTLVDVARSRPVATAVAAIDAALNRRMVTVDELDEVALRCWNWPLIARAQRALRHIDGRAESPLESISHLVIVRLGLPAPELQSTVIDPHGAAVARLDFYWDEFGVAGEADGRAKYTDRDVLTAEKERQERIEALGLPVARWNWTQAWDRPYELRRKLEAAFLRGRARDRSGLPREWSISRTEPIR